MLHNVRLGSFAAQTSMTTRRAYGYDGAGWHRVFPSDSGDEQFEPGVPVLLGEHAVWIRMQCTVCDGEPGERRDGKRHVNSQADCDARSSNRKSRKTEALYYRSVATGAQSAVAREPAKWLGRSAVSGNGAQAGVFAGLAGPVSGRHSQRGHRLRWRWRRFWRRWRCWR